MLRGHLTHRLDRDLARYVLRDERVVVAVRKHWTAHAKPFGLSVLALIVAVWTDIKAPPTPAGAAASQAFWALWLISLIWVAWTVLNWRRDWFVATDKRFLMFYGFITRKVAMMPLAKVTDLTFNRSIMGRLLGYGDFTLESAGQHQALGHIDYIPDADQHYREICAVLFGEDEDDDGNPFRDGGYDDGTEDFGDDDTGGGDPAYPSPASPDRGGEGRDHGDHREAYAVSEARAFGMPVRPSGTAHGTSTTRGRADRPPGHEWSTSIAAARATTLPSERVGRTPTRSRWCAPCLCHRDRPSPPTGARNPGCERGKTGPKNCSIRPRSGWTDRWGELGVGCLHQRRERCHECDADQDDRADDPRG